MKKIILDGRWIRSINIDGIGNFTLNIIKKLIQSDKNEYILLLNSTEIEEKMFSNEFNSIRIIQVANSINSIKSILEIRKIIKEIKPDIYFSPCYSFLEMFLGNKIIKISVIHDLIPIIYSNLFKKASFKFKLFFCNKIAQKIFISKIDKIISVSESTKKDLNKYLGINLNKISVITEGFESNNIDFDENYIKNKYNIDFEFFLFVGRHEIYKNIGKLIEIYSKLDIEIKNKYKLVIIGKFNENTNIFLEQVKNLKEEKNIIFINSVSFDELQFFYKKAKILLHFSLYEGFGLTLLESMANKTPVIAYNTSSIPEVVSDSGILVEIDNEEQIFNAIEKLLTDNEFYDFISKKGLERAKYFSWEKTKEQIEAIF